MNTMEVLTVNNHINNLLAKMVMESDNMARSSYSQNITDEVMKLCTALIEGSHGAMLEPQVM